MLNAAVLDWFQMLRLRIARTMTSRIIGITFKWYIRVVDAHPLVKRVVEKQIDKNRTYDRALSYTSK